jgi:hypothetical protein
MIEYAAYGLVPRTNEGWPRQVVNPTPYTPSWKTVTDFLDKYMK